MFTAMYKHVSQVLVGSKATFSLYNIVAHLVCTLIRSESVIVVLKKRLCFFVSLFLCFLVSLFPCFFVSLFADMLTVGCTL